MINIHNYYRQMSKSNTELDLLNIGDRTKVRKIIADFENQVLKTRHLELKIILIQKQHKIKIS